MFPIRGISTRSSKVVFGNTRSSTALITSPGMIRLLFLELGQRHGFELERFAGIAVRDVKTFRARLLVRLRPLLVRIGFASQLFAKSIIYEFVRT